MQTYLDMLRHIIDNGEFISNGRTKEGYYSVFGYQNRYDLSKGFPAVTTKKLWMKGVVEELLWFIRGETNIKTLGSASQLWSTWADKNGDIGPMYGKQLRNLERVEIVERKILQPGSRSIETGFNKTIEIVPGSTNKNNLLGKTFQSSNSGKFVVIEEYKASRSNSSNFDRWAFKVQFSKTGYQVGNLTKSSVLSGLVKDPFYPSVESVGCLGDSYSPQDKKLLYQTWVGMLKRCYDISHLGYERYGKRGVFVADSWLNFSRFCQDVKQLTNWDMKLEYPDEYSLDKDYYGSNAYSKETCLWLSKLEQNLNREDMVVVRATSPDGEMIETVGVRPLCEQFGLKPIGIHNCLEGKTNTHHGWKFERVVLNNDNQLLRVRRVDQLKKLIARIKHFPSCRRLVVSAWNVMDLDQMALAPCHMAPVQFHVANGKLSCHLYQRSADVFLGVPFNIASYALLTHMIAQVTGLEVGEFVHTFGDLHIYETHIEQVKEQLSREPKPLPTLWLNPEIKDINLFKPEDIKLVGYESHPAIKGEVAV